MWFELHDAVVAHPKTCRAARALGLNRPAVIGHLACLWLWATRYAPDGDISRFDAADIAEAAGYDGDPEAFVHALVTCGPGGSSGYIDQDADGTRLHDWMDHTGRTLANRLADINRKRQSRTRPAQRTEPEPIPEPPAQPAAEPPKPKRTRPAFVPPTPNEVAEHMLAINEGRFDKPRLRRERDLFMAHFAGTGWTSGGAKLRDWRAAVVKWLIRAETDHARQAPAPAMSYDAGAEHFRAALEASDG